ncbi:PhzF family phenazine biosynthesis protein [Shimia abyssi]|uniref:Trans-2,3-dihydro-3-hydroxyanthranilate isomerase n=1 Tax=Shimia abyssi TaxID=1662395 RepID=A0A2P8FG79_9RHOB|nr:PhzF family phenazine biosynthesis protein [Shimia abyssi]PSL20726.1 trans-2,3-dihydro-3-hydroxyanthranilate isomerase [Shimia abyssi]
MTDYLVYDVFSQKPFGGNQLAIIPDATNLPEDDLQRIAREFNFSETTFVYPPKDASHTAQVRIFTPTMEIPFAGHPVVGTCVALADAGLGPDMVLELGIGPLNCHAQNGTAKFTTSAQLEHMYTPDPALVAETLGTDISNIVHSNHPPTMASLGLAFTITELNSRQSLAKLTPDVGAFRRGRDAYPSSLDFAQFAYVRDGNTIHARMFAPLDNIPEDPATGSACATLGALLTEVMGTDQTLTIHQGDDMGRPSVITLATNANGVTISGHAVRTMQGKLVY